MDPFLIVDDDKDLSRAIQRMLQLLGAPSEAVHSAKEAYARLTQGGYAGVLLDVVVGKDNGWEVLVHIKEEAPKLPVVIMSGGSGEDDFVKNAEAFGADAVLSKPFTLEDLKAALDGIIKRSE